MKKIVSYSVFLEVLINFCKKNGVKCFYSSNGHISVLSGDEESFRKISLSGVRPVEPIKSLFFPAKDKMLTSAKRNEKYILLGVKLCDLHAIKVLDKMFLNEYEDDLYKKYRNNVLIISSDCLYPEETCFCTLVGGKPFIEEKDNISDVNISFVDDNSLIIEPFTPFGEEFVENNFAEYNSPSKTDEVKRDSNRNISSRKISHFNTDFLKEDKDNKYYKTLKYTYELEEVWKKESEKCVQCGGCNFICPSCYCFLIREASKSYSEQYRDRVWDVCHFTGYARVAGGANPRKYKYQRFRNRYQCKFVYRYENFGFYACSGCGRCIEVCPAKIDIRKVIRNLVVAKGEQVLVR